MCLCVCVFLAKICAEFICLNLDGDFTEAVLDESTFYESIHIRVIAIIYWKTVKVFQKKNIHGWNSLICKPFM